MKIKKILTVLGSALMVGSTMGIAAAANYSAPFAEGTSAVVHGANADTSDVNAATQISQDLLGTEADTQTADVGVGDESFKIEAPGNELSFDQEFSVIRERITKTQLPTLLADGSIRDVDGRRDYTQRLNLGDHKVTFASLGDSEDYIVNTDLADDEIPVLHVNQESNDAWEVEVDFDTDFDATDVRSGESITIAGKEFTVDPDISAGDDELVLFASTETVSSAVGETTTVDVDGTSYTVEVLGANTDEGTATVRIDGQTFQVEQGDTEWVGEQKFYFNRVFMQTVPEPGASVEIFAGADEVEITNSMGEIDLNGEGLAGVHAKWNGAIDAITDIKFQFLPGELDLDTDEAYYLEKGESIVDPLFGTLQLTFDSASMELKDDDKAVIDFSRSGEDLEVSFTNIDGNEYVLELLTDDEADYMVFHENFYHDNTVALGEDNVTILNEGASSPYITRIVSMTTRNPADQEEIVFEDLSTGDTTTVESGDQLWTTGAYAFNHSDFHSDSNVTTLDNGWYLTDNADGISDHDNTAGDGLYEETTIYAIDNAEIDISGTTSEAASSDVDVREDSEDTPVTHTVTMAHDAEDNGEFEITVDNTNLADGADADGDMFYALSDFGTYVEADDDDKNQATFWIPSEEVTYNVYLSNVGEVSQPDDTGVPVYTDAETESFADKDIVVVGGSAINAIAAELLGGDLSGEDFTAETGVEAGEFLIQSFDRDGRTALLVAGYNAADTTKAANALVDESNEISTDIGTKYVSDEATVSDAQLVSE